MHRAWGASFHTLIVRRWLGFEFMFETRNAIFLEGGCRGRSVVVRVFTSVAGG